jgi:hypothetical protein
MLMKTFKVIFILITVLGFSYLANCQPPEEFDNPKVDFYWIAFEYADTMQGMNASWPVDDPGEDGSWSAYVDDITFLPWFNTWFYNGPLNLNNMKKVRMGFWVVKLNPAMPSFIDWVVNWSSDSWPAGSGYPTSVDEEYVERSPLNHLIVGPPIPGDPGTWVELYFEIPDYNPEWLSVDILGDNISIPEEPIPPPPGSPELFYWWNYVMAQSGTPPPGGIVVHECVPKQGGGIEYDYGDAPEGDTAYHKNAVIGNFPTCTQVGPVNSFISHGCSGTLFFGGLVDCELDGNAAYCPTFGPNWYNMDECGTIPYSFPPNPDPIIGLVDEGLFKPAPNSIFFLPGFYGYAVCGAEERQPLATVCSLARWGQDINIWIDASQFSGTAYFNILFDWNQDGDWNDVVECSPGIAVPEHALVNWQIPHGFNDSASAMLPALPDLQVGPDSGYVWARFTLTEQAIQLPWDGSGVFADGETEDYLLYIAPAGEMFDFGDAPEGDTAYINPMVIGNFPTCMQVGPPNSFARHQCTTAPLFFGGYRDFELDGNAGFCPAFGPNQYNMDECGPYQSPPSLPGDPGLIMPTPMTLGLLTPGVYGYVTCGSGAVKSLDTVCNLAQWGQDIDIWIHSMHGTGGWLNILFDWNQDGDWNDTVKCQGANVFEHALVNWPVPYPFIGPASLLLPPPIQVGPNSGYVWARFTISEVQKYFPWDGAGDFPDGETEDYLLYIAPVCGPEYDYGDAPEGDTAYIDPAVIGNFPTCLDVGPANSFIRHCCPSGLFFGGYVDLETDGNAGYCPTFRQNWYNMDECGTFPYPFPPGTDEWPIVDEGLFLPVPNTLGLLQPSFYGYFICGAVNRQALDTACHAAQWGQDINIWIDASQFSGTAYFNILFDWNQDGDWNDTVQCQGTPVYEHALVNWQIPQGFNDSASAMLPALPPIQLGPNSGYVWARFSLTDQPVPVQWDGSGVFTAGETEDYLLYIAPNPAVIPVSNWALFLGISLIVMFTLLIWWRKK